MSHQLQTIPSHKINTEKWDDCIHKHQALIYCSAAYLNAMADNWVGLVWGNYEAVFPICYRKKYLIKYSYTPAFIQQLGFVGNETIGWNQIEKEIKQFVTMGDIMLNHTNVFANNCFETKTNFIINLHNNYPNIAGNYNNDLKQNLKKAAKENFSYTANNNVGLAIDLYQKYYGEKMKVRAVDFDNFKKICQHLQVNENCLVRQIVNNNNEILAIALLVKDNHRIYNLANTTTALGKKTTANQLLIDRILHEFAGSNLIFDFEGSDLVGVKSFYEKYGAINQPYFHWCLSTFMNKIRELV